MGPLSSCTLSTDASPARTFSARCFLSSAFLPGPLLANCVCALMLTDAAQRKSARQASERASERARRSLPLPVHPHRPGHVHERLFRGRSCASSALAPARVLRCVPLDRLWTVEGVDWSPGLVALVSSVAPGAVLYQTTPCTEQTTLGLPRRVRPIPNGCQ